MILRERVTISAACEAVWPWVADPFRIARWNPKLVAVDRVGEGPLRLGERFEGIYRMKNRDRLTACEVIELNEPGLVVVRHRASDLPGGYVDERYRLEPVRQGTRLMQEIDFGRSGIPWLLQMLMWFIQSTGKPVGKRYLVSLKEIVEAEQAGTASSQSGITKQ